MAKKDNKNRTVEYIATYRYKIGSPFVVSSATELGIGRYGYDVAYWIDTDEIHHIPGEDCTIVKTEEEFLADSETGSWVLHKFNVIFYSDEEKKTVHYEQQVDYKSALANMPSNPTPPTGRTFYGWRPKNPKKYTIKDLKSVFCDMEFYPNYDHALFLVSFYEDDEATQLFRSRTVPSNPLIVDYGKPAISATDYPYPPEGKAFIGWKPIEGATYSTSDLNKVTCDMDMVPNNVPGCNVNFRFKTDIADFGLDVAPIISSIAVPLGTSLTKTDYPTIDSLKSRRTPMVDDVDKYTYSGNFNPETLTDIHETQEVEIDDKKKTITGQFEGTFPYLWIYDGSDHTVLIDITTIKTDPTGAEDSVEVYYNEDEVENWSKTPVWKSLPGVYRIYAKLVAPHYFDCISSTYFEISSANSFPFHFKQFYDENGNYVDDITYNVVSHEPIPETLREIAHDKKINEKQISVFLKWNPESNLDNPSDDTDHNYVIAEYEISNLYDVKMHWMKVNDDSATEHTVTEYQIPEGDVLKQSDVIEEYIEGYKFINYDPSEKTYSSELTGWKIPDNTKDIDTENLICHISAIYKEDISEGKITFKSNYPSSHASKDKTYTQNIRLNVRITLDELQSDWTLDGYSFKNWTSKADGSPPTYVNKDNNAMFKSDTDLYAYWLFTLTYNLNNGSTSKVTISNQRGNIDLYKDSDVKYDGYILTAWSTAAVGGTTYTPGSKYDVEDNVTLYAQWKQSKFKMTYVRNKNNDDIRYNYVDAIGDGEYVIMKYDNIYAKDNDFINKGYVFDTWRDSLDSSGKEYKEGLLIENPGKDMTLYAQWKQVEFKVTYVRNRSDGDKDYSYVDSTKEGNYTIMSYDAIHSKRDEFDKNGYVFSTWKDSSGTEYKEGLLIENPGKDMTLYAQWTEGNFLITDSSDVEIIMTDNGDLLVYQ